MEPLEKQSPVRQSLCGSLRRDGHWKCFCLTFLILTCLTAISWCKITNAQKPSNPYMESPFSTKDDELVPCKEGYIYIPMAFVIMLYLVYLVECWHSHIRLELKYKIDIPTVYSTISSMQASSPVIWWKATCYHYVRRTRQVMRYRNGDAFSSTQVYYERVDSSTSEAAFNFTQCGAKDISRPIHDLEKFQAIKIKVSKGFSFANVDTEYEFEEQRAQFFQDYETKDDYMEGREGMDLMNVDFREYMIAFSDPNRLPWYVSHSAFWVASTLLLSWPLRTIIEYKTAHLHYHIHKLFGSNYLDVENLMTRVNTMTSDDLEMSIRNNNVIVPSYSEAMLNNAFEMQTMRDYGAIKSTHKFPRSLTNVTLAARSSANVISNTPSVTMTQVKRFKSCSAFGEPSSPAELTSSTSGTIRGQISQLFRDRQRLNNKRNTLSSVSVAGFPFFSVRPTDRTPDGVPSIRSSFSTYSVASGRRANPSSTHEVSMATRASTYSLRRSLRRSVPNMVSQSNNGLSDSQTVLVTPSRHYAGARRPSSVCLVTTPSSRPEDGTTRVPSGITHSPSSSYPSPAATGDSPCPQPPALRSPPAISPPHYDEAMRSCLVAESKPLAMSCPRPSQSIPTGRHDNRRPDPPSPATTPLTAASRDTPANSGPAPHRLPLIEPVIGGGACTDTEPGPVTKQPVGSNFTEIGSPLSTSVHGSRPLKLKPLPKISTDQIMCLDTEDEGCLHGDDANSDSDDVDSMITGGGHGGGVGSPTSVTSRGHQFHANDTSGPQLLASHSPGPPHVTLIQEHSAIGGLSRGRDVGGDGGENGCPGSPHRMETSV